MDGPKPWGASKQGGCFAEDCHVGERRVPNRSPSGHDCVDVMAHALAAADTSTAEASRNASLQFCWPPALEWDATQYAARLAQRGGQAFLWTPAHEGRAGQRCGRRPLAPVFFWNRKVVDDDGRPTSACARVGRRIPRR